MRYATIVLALTALTTVTPALAADVSVKDVWARATTPKATMGAVYLSITSKTPDKLIGVSTDVASEAAVHESYKTGNTVGMRPVEALPVSTSAPTVLSPGGYHIMLMGLKQQLVKGKTFPVTLTFEKAGKVETSARVEAAGAAGPIESMDHGMDHHMHHHMPGMGH